MSKQRTARVLPVDPPEEPRVAPDPVDPHSAHPETKVCTSSCKRD